MNILQTWMAGRCLKRFMIWLFCDSRPFNGKRKSWWRNSSNVSLMRTPRSKASFMQPEDYLYEQHAQTNACRDISRCSANHGILKIGFSVKPRDSTNPTADGVEKLLATTAWITNFHWNFTTIVSTGTSPELFTFTTSQFIKHTVWRVQNRSRFR